MRPHVESMIAKCMSAFRTLHVVVPVLASTEFSKQRPAQSEGRLSKLFGSFTHSVAGVVSDWSTHLTQHEDFCISTFWFE